MVKDKIEEIIIQWEQDANVIYAELLAQFNTDIRDAASEKLTVSFDEYKSGIERDFENIRKQAQNSFLFKRLRDSYSLRRKTEDLTAQEVADRLIEETQDELAEAKDNLVNSVIELDNSPAEEIDIALQDWEESFRIEFEKGLLKWQNAENRFMQEYIRWETTAQENMLEAEQAWDEAFVEFREARQNWGQEILLLIQDGREQWADMQRDYTDECDRVMADLLEKTESESAKLQREVSSLISMYDQSWNVVQLAEDNAEYLHGEITRLEEKIASYDAQIAKEQAEKANIVGQLSKYSRGFNEQISYIPYFLGGGNSIYSEILKNEGYYYRSYQCSDSDCSSTHHRWWKNRTGKLTAEKALEFRNQAIEQVYSILHENMDAVEVSINGILDIYNKRIEAYEDIFRLQQELNYWAGDSVDNAIEVNARADLQSIAIFENELRNFTTMRSVYNVNVTQAGTKYVDEDGAFKRIS